MIVAKLLIDHETLIGQEHEVGNFFNPIMDANGNMIVSVEESEYLPSEDFELIEYEPITQDDFIQAQAEFNDWELNKNS